MEKQDKNWHLDKRVPIAIIFALIAQAAFALTWANRVSFELQQLQKDFVSVREDARKVNTAIVEVAALRGIIESIKISIDRQVSRLDSIIELRTQMKDVMQEIQETRREYRNSNARLWDETRNLRNSIVGLGGRPAVNTSRPEPEGHEPPLPARRTR